MIASIRKSALLVADCTGMRRSVFFGAGLGFGLGVPVIWTCRADSKERIEDHFDTRQFNHLVWMNAEDLRERLTARIEATVPNRPKPTDQ